jgi:hypothetical protein
LNGNDTGRPSYGGHASGGLASVAAACAAASGCRGAGAGDTIRSDLFTGEKGRDGGVSPGEKVTGGEIDRYTACPHPKKKGHPPGREGPVTDRGKGKRKGGEQRRRQEPRERKARKKEKKKTTERMKKQKNREQKKKKKKKQQQKKKKKKK